MPDLTHWSRRRLRAWVCTVTAICFLVLASVAANHLHLGVDTDAGCPVCAAVAGKLASAPPAPVASARAITIVWLPATPVVLGYIASTGVVLPPGCGPPVLHA